MKHMVLVPSFLPGIPCARRPTSFPNEYPQSSLNFVCLIRCLYSNSFPISVSKTDPAKSNKKVSEYARLDACPAVGQLSEIATAANNFSRLDFCVLRKLGGELFLMRGGLLVISGWRTWEFGDVCRLLPPNSTSSGAVWMSWASNSSVSDSLLFSADFFHFSSLIVNFYWLTLVSFENADYHVDGASCFSFNHTFTFNYVAQVLCSSQDRICWCHQRLGDVLMSDEDCLPNAHAVGVGYPNFVSAVVFHGVPKVEA